MGRLTHATWRGLIGAVCASLLVALAGCGADLGECDDALAHTLVYDAKGIPHYAGQAMMQEACAGSFCHSANAKNDARLGAPFGLDFDVPVVDGMATADVQEQMFALLGGGHATLSESLEEVWGQVDGGDMPPDGVGDRPKVSWSASDGMGGALPLSEDTVPSVRGKAGKEVLRNWLACGAPVVAGTPGVSEAVADVGDVVASANNAVGVEPNWTSIYEKVIAPSCISCHGPNLFPGTDLDLSAGPGGPSDVLPRLVGQAASSAGPCSGMGTLVVANDCTNSIFVQKLRAAGGTSETCGDPMPLTGLPLTTAEIDAICAWVDMGAQP